MIYFIRRPDCNRIKIGTTIRLSQRLKQLVAEHGPGLEVLAVAEGSFEQERELHHRFGHLRDVGEWFEPGDDLVGFIVAECKEWDGSDEVPPLQDACIKFDKTLAGKARLISQGRGITMTEYLTEMTRPIIDRDYAKLMRELEGGPK